LDNGSAGDAGSSGSSTGDVDGTYKNTIEYSLEVHGDGTRAGNPIRVDVSRFATVRFNWLPPSPEGYYDSHGIVEWRVNSLTVESSAAVCELMGVPGGVTRYWEIGEGEFEFDTYYGPNLTWELDEQGNPSPGRYGVHFGASPLTHPISATSDLPVYSEDDPGVRLDLGSSLCTDLEPGDAPTWTAVVFTWEPPIFADVTGRDLMGETSREAFGPLATDTDMVVGTERLSWNLVAPQ
jgi:hypothetical protein